MSAYGAEQVGAYGVADALTGPFLQCDFIHSM